MLDLLGLTGLEYDLFFAKQASMVSSATGYNFTAGEWLIHFHFIFYTFYTCTIILLVKVFVFI